MLVCVYTCTDDIIITVHCIYYCVYVSVCVLMILLYCVVVTALKPSDILGFFKEISDHANDIQDAYNKCKDPSSRMSIPSVTVFLDEINTASCLGLFKEMIVDRTIDGVVRIHVHVYVYTAMYTCTVGPLYSGLSELWTPL